MKRKKKNTNPKLLAAENSAITQFVFDTVIPKPGAKLPMQAVYTAYGQWRKSNQMPESKLTVDGFGRLFPRVFARRSAYCSLAKHNVKCVFGVALKGAQS